MQVPSASRGNALFGADSRRLLIELLQPFAAEVDIKDFITGLWSLGMAPWPGAL